jgi:regulator of sigma E protease
VDLYLVADLSTTLAGILGGIYTFGLVALGLGAVIFVHELGHFLVAKACGVKCEKFYVGFDVPINLGLFRIPGSLVKFRWGETEYGIGSIPLGGYVKMLGQDDNPANAESEADRIRVVRDGESEETAVDDASSAGVVAQSESGDKAASNVAASNVAADEEFELDPRSYPAKNVPQRMAIISAGVIMNLLFAIVFGAIAFKMGAPHTPCVAGQTTPGSPAWLAGIQPGDRIVGLNGKKSEHLRFFKDLMIGVLLNKDRRPIDFLVKRGEETLEMKITPQHIVGDRYAIGMANSSTLLVGGINPYRTANEASPALLPKDEVKKVNGQEVKSSFEYGRLIAVNAGIPIVLEVERKIPQEDETAEPKIETLNVTVEPQVTKTLGLAMKMGGINGFRPGSAASESDLNVGDVIVSVNGQLVGDPMRLESRLIPFIGQEVELGIQRDGKTETVKITPHAPLNPAASPTPFSCAGAETIGVAYNVIPEVVTVDAESSAAKAGVKPGDVVKSLKSSTMNKELLKEHPAYFKEVFKIDAAEGLFWQHAFSLIQVLPKEEVNIEMTLDRGGKEVKVSLERADGDWFLQDRGIQLAAASETHTAKSWSEAFSLGFRETQDRFVEVLTVLSRLVTGGISPTNLGGPVGIIRYAGSEAAIGISRLLLFLTFLSANLAIVNFLPIPALDGGHMVFLTWELIVGKPVNERIQMNLTLVGVFFLLSLIVCVTFSDVFRMF